MRSAFAGLGVELERFAAIDGERLPQEIFDAINGRNRWVRPLVRAEAGCLLSHLACWESIAAGTAAFGAVFEDDMHLSPHAGTLLCSCEWIPADADFIKLETRLRAITIDVRSRRVSAGHKLARLRSFHDGLGGYIVSKQCAARLCSLVRKHTAPVDQLVLNPRFDFFTELAAFQLIPAICMPNQLIGQVSTAASPSTIDPRGDLYRADEILLRQRSGAPRGRMRRELERIAAGLRRLTAGQRKVRIQFR